MTPARVRALRVLLLLVVGLGTLAQLASHAVPSDLETAVAQAQDGRLRTLQLYEGGGTPGFRVRVGGQRDDDPRLVWSDARRVLHVAPLPQGSSSSDDDGEQDLLATVRAAAPAGSRPDVVPPGSLLRDRVASLGSLAVLALLVLLVVGPQPRRATKWGWAWLVTVLPVSLGALALLVRDAPWSRTASDEPEPPPGPGTPGRTTGGLALLHAAAVTLVLGLLALGVTSLVPGLSSRYERPAPYDVVRTDGTRAPGVLTG